MFRLKYFFAFICIVSGILITALIPYFMKPETTGSNLLKLISVAIVVTLINFIVSILLVRQKPKERYRYGLSAIVGMVANMALLTMVAYAQGDQETLMWLPVILIFAPFYIAPSVLGALSGVYFIYSKI